MPDQDQPHPRHHLLIAGTGRAGASFLVRWLAAAGLKTHLATHDTPVWDDDANAGLEDLPIVADWKSAPYVMKSPWLVEVIDDVLANPRIVLDAVMIPVRDLTKSAASRVVQELQSAHRKNPWLSGLTHSFEQWGTTPGGVVYSLDPVDPARLLAVSFHRLVQRLVRADIPIVLLDFPRLALDAEYLFGKLRRFVPATAAQAIEAHARSRSGQGRRRPRTGGGSARRARPGLRSPRPARCRRPAARGQAARGSPGGGRACGGGATGCGGRIAQRPGCAGDRPRGARADIERRRSPGLADPDRHPDRHGGATARRGRACRHSAAGGGRRPALRAGSPGRGTDRAARQAGDARCGAAGRASAGRDADRRRGAMSGRSRACRSGTAGSGRRHAHCPGGSRRRTGPTDRGPELARRQPGSSHHNPGSA